MTSSVNGKRYIGSAVNIKARVFQGHVLELKKKIHPNSHLQNLPSFFNAVLQVSFIYSHSPHQTLLDHDILQVYQLILIYKVDPILYYLSL